MGQNEAPSGVKLRIAIPCFGGLIHVACVTRVMSLFRELARAGIECALETVIHESLVTRARNTLVHQFLASDSTHLLFIDADIVFEPRDVIGMLIADKPVVCAAYPKKSIEWPRVVAAVKDGMDPASCASPYAINALPPEGDEQLNPDGSWTKTLTMDRGCIPILDAATGFLMVKRHVLLDMAAAHPEAMYQSDAPGNRGEPMWALFDCAIVDGRYLSEDYLFSRRWQRMGGTVWLYLPAKLGHIGSHTFQGDLSSVFHIGEQTSGAAGGTAAEPAGTASQELSSGGRDGPIEAAALSGAA